MGHPEEVASSPTSNAEATRPSPQTPNSNSLWADMKAPPPIALLGEDAADIVAIHSPRSTLSTPGAMSQGFGIATMPSPPQTAPPGNIPRSLQSSPRSSALVKKASRGKISATRRDTGTQILDLTRQLSSANGTELPSFDEKSLGGSPRHGGSSGGPQKKKSQKMLQLEAWKSFLAGRDKREKDLLFQQKKNLKNLDAELQNTLRRGDIRLLSLRWLLEARPTRIRRRQEMESVDTQAMRRDPNAARPFVPAEDAATLLRRGERRVLVLSYPWLQELDPDPVGERCAQVLRLVEHIARKLGIRDNPAELERYGLFWDFPCVHQRPRTEREEGVYRRAMSEMAHLYASALGTCVFFLDNIPTTPAHLDGVVRVSVESKAPSSHALRLANGKDDSTAAGERKEDESPRDKRKVGGGMQQEIEALEQLAALARRHGRVLALRPIVTDTRDRASHAAASRVVGPNGATLRRQGAGKELVSSPPPGSPARPLRKPSSTPSSSRTDENAKAEGGEDDGSPATAQQLRRRASVIAAEEKILQRQREHERNEELDAAVTELCKYLDEGRPLGGEVRAAGSGRSARRTTGGGGGGGGGGGVGGIGGGGGKLSAPKRYDIVYPSQAVAMTACAALPAETPTLHIHAFLGYNSRPWAARGWGIAERALARDVMSRAQTYPMLLDWLNSVPLSKAYCVADDGSLAGELDGINAASSSGRRSPHADISSGRRSPHSPLSPHSVHSAGGGMDVASRRASVASSAATGAAASGSPRGKSAVQLIIAGTFTYPKDRNRLVSLYASAARGVASAFEQAEATREHALLEASKGHGEQAQIARKELIEHRKRVKDLLGAEPPLGDVTSALSMPKRQLSSRGSSSGGGGLLGVSRPASGVGSARSQSP